MVKRYQGKTDIALTPTGIRQAKAVARALMSYHPNRLYTSTLRRAKETGREIERRLKLRAIHDARLNELDFGDWEGENYRHLAEEAGSEFKKWREGRLTQPPGGESVAALSRRVSQFFKEILRRHTDETIAVVSHGGPIKVFLFSVLKTKRASVWSFRIDPGSITLIEGDTRLLQIICTNRLDHLPS